MLDWWDSMDWRPITFAIGIGSILLWWQRCKVSRVSTSSERVDLVSVNDKDNITPPLIASAESSKTRSPDMLVPRSVNYHFTRKCNYTCGFCFHTAKTSNHQPLERAKQGMSLLKEAGMEKINFSGGEPLIVDKGRYLGQLCKYCHEIGLFVSIVSNGSLMTQEWLSEFGNYINVVAISCDSFHPEINRSIGRSEGKKYVVQHADQVVQIAKWCSELNIQFKLNTVVNAYNWQEDMSEDILRLKPIRWKVFQCLEVDGENKSKDGSRTKRDVTPFLVTDEQFATFVKNHESRGCKPTAEVNHVMRSSYWLLDEQLRFLDCSTGAKVPSICILDDLPLALRQAQFAEKEFLQRDGDFYKEKSSRAIEVELESSSSPLSSSSSISSVTSVTARTTRISSLCDEDLKW